MVNHSKHKGLSYDTYVTMCAYCSTFTIYLRCLEYLCKYATVVHGINERDHHYLTPLHIAVTSNLPGHVKRLLMAKVR